MTVVEHAPEDEILDFIKTQVVHYRQEGVEARYIVTGKTSYPRLCRAISVDMVRGKGQYETYGGIPIVLDPFRDDAVCVLPGPAECDKGVDAVRV